MPWLVRTVRFTSFLTPDAVVDDHLWQAVLGGDPEQTVHQRPAGLRQDIGRFEDAAATVAVQPGRVDCIFAPVETSAPQWEALGPFPDAVQRYLAPVLRWSESERFPPTRRLALGLHLVEPTETRETGYARLRDFVDSVPQGEASDFLYQVNRYRPSRVFQGLTVNRLAKWSVSQIQLFTLDGVGLPRTGGRTLSFVNLELDVNTSADFAGPIPPASVNAIAEELRRAAEEIATAGDRVPQ